MGTVSLKTVTKIQGGDITVSCYADITESGGKNPELFKANLLDGRAQINGVNGIEGELLLSYGETKVGNLDAEGNLIIELDNDDENKYQLSNENLNYTE